LLSWDLFIMIFVIFCAIEVPLEISYGVPESGNIINILNWSINLVFFFDICINFRTAYIDDQGYMVSRRGGRGRRRLAVWIESAGPEYHGIRPRSTA